MSSPFKLFRLQQIDLQLDRTRARLREIQAALEENSVLRAVMGKVAARERELQESKKILQRAEGEVQAQRIKIEQTEASLYGGKIRNPKELQDLQNEAAALKRYRDVLEDRQLEAMMSVEEFEGALDEAATELKAVQERGAVQNASLLSEQSALYKDVERLENERQAATSSLEAPELRTYEQLRLARNGIAVAKVTDRACAACGSTLSAALLSAARSPNQITRCSTCNRILYMG
jgi:predicted  nucleic acid-binding Zn-ribbon protein